MQTFLRDLPVGALALWGLANLIGLRRVREIPALRQARGLAGAGGVLLALALALNAPRLLPVRIALGSAAVVCLSAWLRGIYTHSLHNTTM